MAIYHLSIKTVGRSEGRSATAAAAYRSGGKIADQASGLTFDYTHKQGVEHSEIVLATKAARLDVNWARDRHALWNAAEAAEKRKDARVAREYELAIPHELDKSQRRELVREFSGYLANRYGVAVDFAIHRAHRQGDPRNHHAHVLTTTREVTCTGLGAKTALELSETNRAKLGMPHSRVEFVEIRERWAVLSNEQLRRCGHEERIDHRTLAAQGIDRPPTIHRGAAVTALIRRGAESTVERRLAWQEQPRILQRLEAVRVAGALDRQRRRLDSGRLHLSTDVRAARRARDADRTIDGAQARSREAWLAYRMQQEQVKSKAQTLAPPEVAPGRDPLLKVKPASAVLLDRNEHGPER